MRATDLHARIPQGAWRGILLRAGVPEEYLRGKKHPGPCPLCGGRDRYFYDDRWHKGEYFCRGCGPGDGLTLLQKYLGIGFVDALRMVAQIIGLEDCRLGPPVTMPKQIVPLRPSRRVWTLLRGSCLVSHCEDAVAYLDSRGLWPLPSGCNLCAHPLVDYWQGDQRVGKYPALVATVTDIVGELVTLHVTYLEKGEKLRDRQTRKLLGPVSDREGCSVRLSPLHDDVLGIAEGIETALSATLLHGVPTWAALSAPVLRKFTPPGSVRRLIVYADRDSAGLEAADYLADRLPDLRVEIQPPPAPAGDWNDVLTRGLRQHG